MCEVGKRLDTYHCMVTNFLQALTGDRYLARCTAGIAVTLHGDERCRATRDMEINRGSHALIACLKVTSSSRACHVQLLGKEV